MLLTVTRKSIFSRFGGPGWPLIRALFQVWISVCVFNSFYLISYDLGRHFDVLWAPLGSLGQPIYSPKGTCVRIGAKVGSRILKE